MTVALSPWLSLLKSQRSLAVIRSSHSQAIARQMALAVAAGGMSLIEITWNTRQAGELIARLRSELPNCAIGTGTILEAKELEEALAVGAQFIFTPHVNLELIDKAVAAEIPIIPGALSPTEIVTAWQAGASCVKVFPIQAVGGARYIQSLQAPLGHIPLIPTGGVTIANAPDFIAAGAIAVGLAGDLFPSDLVESGNWTGVSQQARLLLNKLAR
jgi:2-dehydro-3-deoxyphosphogluconate aldolase / (4S)-4-hydroxy-2-oxoglutarate aldolase